MGLSANTRSKCRNCGQEIAWLLPEDTYVRQEADPITNQPAIENRSFYNYSWWHIPSKQFVFDESKFSEPRSGALTSRHVRRYDNSNYAEKTKFGPVFIECLELPPDHEPLWNPHATSIDYCAEHLNDGGICNRPIKDKETMMCGIHAKKEHERIREREKAAEERERYKQEQELRKFIEEQFQEKINELNDLWDLDAKPEYGFLQGRTDRIEVSYTKLKSILDTKVEEV